MPVIQAFKAQGEDLELVWLAGFTENPELGWQVRAVTRGLTSNQLRQQWLPIGLLPLLALGRCFVDGNPAYSSQRGEIIDVPIGDVAEGVEVTSEVVPPDLLGNHGHRPGVQRLFRYRHRGIDILAPAIEMVRYFFAHNKTLANALMRPGGLLGRCRPEPLGFHQDLHLHFTSEMPVSVLKPPFVQEFAWIAVHPEGRRSWDSVAELTTGNRYVRFRPPRITNSTWTVRHVRSGNTALVLEIMNISGRQHPCDVLRYSHPSIRQRIVALGEASSDDKEGDQEPLASKPVREVRDYVVDDDGRTRADIRQSALPGPTKGSGFDREIDIVRVTDIDYRPIGKDRVADTTEADKQSGTTDDEELKRRQIRVRAGVSEPGVSEQGAGAQLPPIKFELLEPAEPGYLGSFKPLH